MYNTWNFTSNNNNRYDRAVANQREDQEVFFLECDIYQWLKMPYRYTYFWLLPPKNEFISKIEIPVTLGKCAMDKFVRVQNKPRAGSALKPDC